MGEFIRVYFLNSTIILYIATLVYVTMTLVWEVQTLSIFFSFLYCIELLLKYVSQDSIYWSPYFSYPFITIDVLAGPIAFGFSIDNASRQSSGIHLGCVFIISKVLTSRLNMKIAKELYYIFKATRKYFRLSISLALCFIVTSYFLFQPYTKYFRNIGQTFYSMYQLCTFDGWISEGAKQIRKNSSNYWLLFFAVYFVVIMLCYLIAILSFFIIYYSTKELQQDFQYKEERFIMVKTLAVKLGLKKKSNKSLIAKAQILILYFALVGLLEWIYPKISDFRPVFVAVILFYSLGYMIYRILKYGWTWNLSHSLLFFRGVVCSVLFIVGALFKLKLNMIIAIYLLSCILDLIRHNALLQIVLRRYYKNIVEYLVILSCLCYLFAVILFNRKSLVKFNNQTQTFLDLYLLNIQIIGLDSWGDKAHTIIQERVGWVWCIVVLILIGALTVTNMFLGEVLVQMSPYIKEILKVQKLYYTKLPCENQQQFQQLCKRQLQKQNWKMAQSQQII